jgi:ankyrin repeat protein
LSTERLEIGSELTVGESAVNPNDFTHLQEGWTPLHSAAQNGHLEVVRLLLGHGANREAIGGPVGSAE